MATLTLDDDDVTVEVPDGTSLPDAIDAHGLKFPFGCFDGHCAACMIQVHEGLEGLSPVHPVERYTLTRDELARGVRLGCKIVLERGHVRIESI